MTLDSHCHPAFTSMNLVNKIRQTGLRYTFAIIFNRIVPEWLFRCRRYVVYQLNPNMAGPAGSDSVRIAYCSKDEIPAVEKLTYVSAEKCTSSDDPNDLRPVKAEFNGELAGGLWMATRMFQEMELGVRYELAPKQAWLFGALVDKPARGKGIYSKMLSFVVPEEAAKGHTQILVAVNPDNRPSHRVHQKNSVRKIGIIRCMRLLKSSWCWASGDLEYERSFSLNSFNNPILIRFKEST